ncbi:NAD(P)H quinone oxidoreductase, PIG3 family [Novosphingobium resinovorum]|uniref:NAD(P)H quinone oxidoreductase, PIG3 family n=1 Tax=Novosphingobium resinovorum TaxID=158500 RepID=A0A031JFK8_9SPHN|nr:zinc-binding alcohol dehydrogenase family protein [Novosphingobium resinovorum]EZP71505.1 NAD(P)H quinone oxidoreductase, PIG3 family [Novosphingobium resinovorum]
MTSIDGHILRMTQYGGPEVLELTEVSVPTPGPGEIRVRTRYAGINYTDLKIRAGLWPIRGSSPFPYVPGVEVVGEIEAIGADVQDLDPGQAVITMMQGLGGVRAQRDGGYAEFVVVAADAVAVIPDGVDALAMAALGLPGVTAFEGLRRLGPIGGGRILITGAAGGVGAAATSIAKASGATVTALITRKEQIDYVRSQGAHDVIVGSRDAARDLGASRFDAVFDVVGGTGFGVHVASLRDGGALCLVGAAGGGDVGFDAWQLIRPITLTGYSTETLDGPSLRDAIARLGTLIASGNIVPPRHRLVPLDAAAEAHREIERGNSERVLLIPQAGREV